MIHRIKCDDGERGASLVEYSLVVALIALAALAGVATFGSSLASNITASADSLATDTSTTTTVPPNQEKEVHTDESGDVRFQEVDGKVRIDNISPADGWTAKVTKDNGTRAIVRFTNSSTGERVVVTSYLTAKGKLVTKIK